MWDDQSRGLRGVGRLTEARCRAKPTSGE